MSWAWFWFICLVVVCILDIRSYFRAQKATKAVEAALNAALATAVYKRDPKKVAVMYIENLAHTSDSTLYQEHVNSILVSNGMTDRVGPYELVTSADNGELLDKLSLRISETIQRIGNSVEEEKDEYRDAGPRHDY